MEKSNETLDHPYPVAVFGFCIGVIILLFGRTCVAVDDDQNEEES